MGTEQSDSSILESSTIENASLTLTLTLVILDLPDSFNLCDSLEVGSSEGKHLCHLQAFSHL